MSINEKTFQQILSLHSKGLGEDASLLGILQLTCGHADHREAVKWVKRFYQETEGIHLTNESRAINALVKCGFTIDAAREIVMGGRR